MNDEQLISLLRVGADSAPLAQTDIARAQVVGRRMRRRRHAAGAVGSGLAVAGFVALLSVAGTSGQPVVQSTLPASPGAPASSGTGADNACDPTLREQIQNTARVRDVLGSTDWQLAPAGTRSCPKGVFLNPTARSAVLAALPAGDSATASIGVTPASNRTNTCPAAVKNGPPMLPCTTRQNSNGQTVVIERLPLADSAVPAGSGQSHAGARQGARAVYVRPDGILASVGVDVDDPDVTPARSHQVDAWLDSFAAKMADAATDPALSGAAAKQARAALAADLARFRDHLGPEGWQVAHNGETTLTFLEPIPGSPVADGLPSGYGAQTRLETHQPDDPMYQNECRSFVETGTTFAPCTSHQTPDGTTVRIQQQHTKIAGADKEVWDAIRVIYARPDGSHEMVELDVFDDKSQATRARQQQAVAWLNSYLDKLIATVTDPAIATAQPPPNQ